MADMSLACYVTARDYRTFLTYNLALHILMYFTTPAHDSDIIRQKQHGRTHKHLLFLLGCELVLQALSGAMARDLAMHLQNASRLHHCLVEEKQSLGDTSW